MIVKVNGQDVDDATITTRVVGSLAAGSRNKFEIYRDGKRQTIDVRVGERPANLGQIATGSAPESDSSEIDSDETLLSGSNNQIADISKEGSGDINAPSPTESEVLKTAMDKLPPLDI